MWFKVIWFTCFWRPFHWVKKETKIRNVSCEFMKHQSLKSFLWPSLRTHLMLHMTSRDLRNIHTTQGHTSLHNIALKLTSIFTYWWRSLLVATSKFGLLTIRQHSVTKKHLFMYLQGDRSDLRKPKKRINININHSYHKTLALYVSLNWPNDSGSVLIKLIWKDGVQGGSMW